MNTVCKNRENSKIEEKVLHSAFRGIIAKNYPLSHLSTFKVGGDASFFIEPFSIDSLVFALEYLKGNSFFIFGGASNLVISDEGIKIPVLSTRSLKNISVIEKNTETTETKEKEFFLRCEAGASIDSLIDFCIEKGFTGLENFAGLPGSIGGAVYMNARCYDVSISDVLSEVRFIDCKKMQNSLDFVSKDFFESSVFDEKDWDYKKSPFQDNKKLIVEVILKVKKADTQSVREKADKYIADRKEKGHFRFPSAGSVFKNNRSFGKPSGKIIDEAGLKGFQIGGAQIAPWHGNFIINRGTATAKDIKNLVIYIKELVREKCGFDLEPEILFTDILINNEIEGFES